MVIKFIVKKIYMNKGIFLVVILVLVLLVSLEAGFSGEVLSENQYDHEEIFFVDNVNVENSFFLVGDVSNGGWHI